MKMTRFTAFTRVLARWMLYGTIGAVVLRLWGEGMFWASHLVITHHGCDGTWFYSAVHILGVLVATLWAAMAAGVLYCVWMLLDLLRMAFAKALVRERQCSGIRR